MKLKRIEPGYYRAEDNGKSVVIYKTTVRGSDGGKCVGWNLQINGRTVSDWHHSKQSALDYYTRHHRTS
jgi:hypothetical protein